MGVIKVFHKTPQQEQKPEPPKEFHYTPTVREIPGKTFTVELTEREAVGPLTITVPITEPEPEPPRTLKVTFQEK